LVSRRLRLLVMLPAASLVVAVAGGQPLQPVQQASAAPLEKLDKRLRAHISGTLQMELDASAPQASAQTSGA
jgi:hypothetical protein